MQHCSPIASEGIEGKVIWNRGETIFAHWVLLNYSCTVHSQEVLTPWDSQLKVLREKAYWHYEIAAEGQLLIFMIFMVMIGRGSNSPMGILKSYFLRCLTFHFLLIHSIRHPSELTPYFAHLSSPESQQLPLLPVFVQEFIHIRLSNRGQKNLGTAQSAPLIPLFSIPNNCILIRLENSML